MTISKSLSRRLERLEEELAPFEVLRVLQIVSVDSDGSPKNGPGRNLGTPFCRFI